MGKITESKEEVKILEKSGWEAGVDNFKDFIKEAFLKTPFETIFEVFLLIAGGTRTINFMNGMGQSGFIATIALIYAEVGLIFMEFLSYRGKRVQYEYTKKRTGEKYKSYPTFNQKSLAKIGLWLVHIPMTVFFTASDVIKTNLENMANKSSLNITDFDSTFAWILGIVIAFAFFMDLVIIINYKSTNPETKHREEMNQLEHDKLQWSMEKEKFEAQARLEYQRNNAKKLAGLKAKLETRKEIKTEFGDDLGNDYLDSVLEEIDITPQRKDTPKTDSATSTAEENKKRKYVRSGKYEKKQELETDPKNSQSPEEKIPEGEDW